MGADHTHLHGDALAAEKYHGRSQVGPVGTAAHDDSDARTGGFQGSKMDGFFASEKSLGGGTAVDRIGTMSLWNRLPGAGLAWIVAGILWLWTFWACAGEWQNTDAYSYGFFVPLLAGYFFWRR